MRAHPPIVEEAYSIIESRISDDNNNLIYYFNNQSFIFPYIEPNNWRYKKYPQTYSFFHSEYSDEAYDILWEIIDEIKSKYS